MYIETERLIIRHPQQEDVIGAFDFKKDNEATNFVGGTTNLSIDDFKSKFNEFCNSYDNDNPFECSVILKSINSYIGYCGVKYCNIMKGDEILYGLNSKYWNKGYGFEAAYEILKYAFNILDYNNMKAAVNPQNPISEKILIKLGFILKKKIEWPEQGLVNMYEITKHEFNSK